MARRSGVSLALVVLFCLCGGIVVVGAAAPVALDQPGADELTADRTLNKTVAEPGETVRVTTTVSHDNAGPVDYLDEFQPAFNDDASLVSVTANGTPVSEALLGEFNDTIIVSVENVPPGEVVFTYDVTVPEFAASGETYSFDGLVQSEENGDETQTSVGGESTLLVGGGAPTFAVSLSSVPASVTVGEELSVEATITNTGLGTGTQQVSLDVNGEQQASAEVTLGPNESEAVTFNHTATQADTPEIDIGVSSENETGTETVAVTEQAYFAVSLSSVPASVTVGEELSVEATITNTGEETGTQQVSFDVDGEQAGSTGVALDSNESESVSFSYTVAETDLPALNLTVSSENETGTETVAVTEQAYFAVSLSSVPEAIPADGQLSAVATVTNTGGTAETQDVVVTVNADAVADAQLTLRPGESENVSFDYGTSSGDQPALNVTASSTDETITASVVVTEAAFFSVELSSVTASVPVGGTITVDALVTNLGGNSDTQSVTVAVGGEQVTEAQVTLAPGSNETLTAEYTVAETGGTELPVEAATNDDSAGATVTVLEPPLFDVTSLSVEGPATPGAELPLTATVTNVGEVEATQSVVLTADGEVQESKRVALAGGASETVTLAYVPTDTGELELTLSTENVSAVETVRVLDPATFDVQFSSIDETVTANETVSVAFTVENIGGVGGTQTVVVSVDGDPVANETLTLGSGERATVTSNYTWAVDAPATLEVVVETANHSVSATVEVMADSGRGTDNSTEPDDETGADNRTEGDGTGDASGPGFGVGTLVLTVLCLGAVGRRQLAAGRGEKP